MIGEWVVSLGLVSGWPAWGWLVGGHLGVDHMIGEWVASLG